MIYQKDAVMIRKDDSLAHRSRSDSDGNRLPKCPCLYSAGFEDSLRFQVGITFSESTIVNRRLQLTLSTQDNMLRREGKGEMREPRTLFRDENFHERASLNAE